ncbi:hypothetical protein DID75_05260 [Candidatus Marinamargulisbacteria bacterium SCGC AG-410-N11]|nr:hypothetical protein DID75_05260 [Candidatus Marinamargulisbacteria bacterium SCGC AG-410-N11]
MMMLRCFILVMLCLVSTSIFSVEPTRLVRNELIFSEGGGFSDAVPDTASGSFSKTTYWDKDNPDNETKADTSGDHYTTWLGLVGVKPGIVGTMNVKGGIKKSFIVGHRFKSIAKDVDVIRGTPLADYKFEGLYGLPNKSNENESPVYDEPTNKAFTTKMLFRMIHPKTTGADAYQKSYAHMVAEFKDQRLKINAFNDVLRSGDSASPGFLGIQMNSGGNQTVNFINQDSTTLLTINNSGVAMGQSASIASSKLVLNGHLDADSVSTSTAFVNNWEGGDSEEHPVGALNDGYNYLVSVTFDATKTTDGTVCFTLKGGGTTYSSAFYRFSAGLYTKTTITLSAVVAGGTTLTLAADQVRTTSSAKRKKYTTTHPDAEKLYVLMTNKKSHSTGVSKIAGSWYSTSDQTKTRAGDDERARHTSSGFDNEGGPNYKVGQYGGVWDGTTDNGNWYVMIAEFFIGVKREADGNTAPVFDAGNSSASPMQYDHKPLDQAWIDKYFFSKYQFEYGPFIDGNIAVYNGRPTKNSTTNWFILDPASRHSSGGQYSYWNGDKVTAFNTDNDSRFFARITGAWDDARGQTVWVANTHGHPVDGSGWSDDGGYYSLGRSDKGNPWKKNDEGYIQDKHGLKGFSGDNITLLELAQAMGGSSDTYMKRTHGGGLQDTHSYTEVEKDNDVFHVYKQFSGGVNNTDVETSAKNLTDTSDTTSITNRKWVGFGFWD